MRKWRTAPTSGHFTDTRMTKPCRNAQSTGIQNFILLDQFQIALPLSGNGIIVRAPTGAYPVDASHDPTMRCRRKRLHTPEGETQNAQSDYQRTEYVRRSGQRYAAALG